MRTGLHVVWFGVVLALASLPASSRPDAPDLILDNGKIFTSNATRPYAQALAIRGERIVALAGPQTRRIDLAGRVAIAGINDAHNHLSIQPPDTVEIETKTWNPDWPKLRAALAHSQGITREQAVIAYTRGSAYAEFTEGEKGTLESGKLADLAVLSQDIFTAPLPELPKTLSVLTLVGGKIVYDAKAL